MMEWVSGLNLISFTVYTSLCLGPGILANLSQRLIGELIIWQGLYLCVVCRGPHANFVIDPMYM